MADTPTNSATLKTYFETGDTPTQQQFADWLTSYRNNVDMNQLDGINTAVTAFAGGGQGSATQLTNYISIITTCASDNDSVKAPNSQFTQKAIIYNSTAKNVNVFPASGETFANLTTNTAISLKAGYFLILFGSASAGWYWKIESNTGRFAEWYNSSTSPSSITPVISNSTIYYLTALANDVTINNPISLSGQKDNLVFFIKDNGTSRALTFDTNFEGTYQPLPARTVKSKWLLLEFSYNPSTSKWQLISSKIEGIGSNTYSTYMAQFNQSGTSAPTINVLLNTLGGVPVWTYDSVGNYTMTLTGKLGNVGYAFSANMDIANGSATTMCNDGEDGPDQIHVKTLSNVGIETNGGIGTIILYVFN